MSAVTVDTHLLDALKAAERLSRLDINNFNEAIQIICAQGYLRAVLPELIAELETKNFDPTPVRPV